MGGQNSGARFLIQQLALDERQSADSNGRANGLVCFRELEESEYRVGLHSIDPQADYRQRVPELQRSLYDALTPQGYVAEQGRYWIPITISRAEAGTPPPDQCAELTAIAPLRRNGDGVLAPLRQGWLYIFVNGHLWREVYCRGKNRTFRDRDYYQFERFEEVNLATKQGLDDRAPSALLDKAALVVPTALADDPAPTVQVAFSEVQWSWEYLCRLGGMSADDPRVIPEVQERFDGVEIDETLQRDRFQSLDLGGYPNGTADTKSDLVIPIDQAFESDRENGLLHHLGYRNYVNQNQRNLVDSGIPAVVIHDPIGEAKDWAAKLHDTVETFAGWASQNAHPHTVATYATQLIDENPDYVEQVRYGAIEDFMARYEREKDEFQERQARCADGLLACLERTGAPNSVVVAFSDYQLDDAHESSRYRNVGELGAQCWAYLTEMLSDSANGFDFLRRQLETETSITHQCLRVFDNPDLEKISRPEAPEEDGYQYQLVQRRADWRNQVKNSVKLTDLGYKALEHLLGTLARPVSEAKQHWEHLSPRLEKLYGIRITAKEVSYSEWHEMNRSSSSSNYTAISAASPDAKTASHRVKILVFDDQPIAAHRALGALKGLPAHVLNIAQVMNLTISWEELAKNGIDTQVNKLALLENSLSTISLVYDVASQSGSRLGQALNASKLARVGIGGVGVVANIVGAMKDMEEAEAWQEQGFSAAAAAKRNSAAGSAVMASSGVLFLLSANPLGVLAFSLGAILVVTGLVRFEVERIGPFGYWLRYGFFGRFAYGEGVNTNEVSHALLDDSREWRVDPQKEIKTLYDFIVGFEMGLKIENVYARDGAGRSAPRVFRGKKIILEISACNYSSDRTEFEVYLEYGTDLKGRGGVVAISNGDGGGLSFYKSGEHEGVTKLVLHVPTNHISDDADYAMAKVCRKELGVGSLGEGVVVVDRLGNGKQDFSRKNHLGEDV